LAGEKAVFKFLQEIALQVNATVGTYPAPAFEVIEAPVWTIKGGGQGFGHGSTVGRL
jgi:hypothetical protein